MTKVFTIHQREEWISYIQKAKSYDSFHSWNMHALANFGTPLLFIYEEGENFIALPVLKRAITGTDYYDLTCVYGYVGPICNIALIELSNKTLENFKLAFDNFLGAEKCITVFSRTNPFLGQLPLLEKFGGLYENGYTLAIDLTQPIEQQRKKYRTTTYDCIKKAWRNNYQLRGETSDEAIDTFLRIYHETMERVEADRFYRFDKDYIRGVLNSDEYDARLLTAYDGEAPIASTIVLISSGVIQAFLIASCQEYLKLSPSKFIVDAVSQLGRELGLKYYNLGGGLGFKDNSLLDWKRSFTKLHLRYRSWRYVADLTAYNQ